RRHWAPAVGRGLLLGGAREGVRALSSGLPRLVLALGLLLLGRRDLGARLRADAAERRERDVHARRARIRRLGRRLVGLGRRGLVPLRRGRLVPRPVGLLLTREKTHAPSLRATSARVAPRGGSAARSDLLDRRDLDEQLLGTRLLEAHVRDALGALPRHGVDRALAEVVVTDAVAGGELEVAVVAHLACDAVRELGERGRRRGLALEGAHAPAVLARPRRVERARLRAAARVDVARRLAPVDEIGGDLLQEPARHRDRDLAKLRARHGERQIQALAGAGDADVEQPALLLRPARLARRDAVRDEILLDAREEDRVELEALGRVQRHERDGARRVVEVVAVGDERDLGEEVDDRALGVVARELARDGHELVEVLDSSLVLRILRLPQRIEVARLVQQHLQPLGDRARRRLFPRRRQQDLLRLAQHGV